MLRICIFASLVASHVTPAAAFRPLSVDQRVSLLQPLPATKIPVSRNSHNPLRGSHSVNPSDVYQSSVNPFDANGVKRSGSSRHEAAPRQVEDPQDYATRGPVRNSKLDNPSINPFDAYGSNTSRNPRHKAPRQIQNLEDYASRSPVRNSKLWDNRHHNPYGTSDIGTDYMYQQEEAYYSDLYEDANGHQHTYRAASNPQLRAQQIADIEQQANSMNVEDIKKALHDMGIETTRLHLRSEIVSAFANALLDFIEQQQKIQVQQEAQQRRQHQQHPDAYYHHEDPNYRDVDVEKMDLRHSGFSVIDVDPQHG